MTDELRNFTQNLFDNFWLKQKDFNNTTWNMFYEDYIERSSHKDIRSTSKYSEHIGDAVWVSTLFLRDYFRGFFSFTFSKNDYKKSVKIMWLNWLKNRDNIFVKVIDTLAIIGLAFLQCDSDAGYDLQFSEATEWFITWFDEHLGQDFYKNGGWYHLNKTCTEWYKDLYFFMLNKDIKDITCYDDLVVDFIAKSPVVFPISVDRLSNSYLEKIDKNMLRRIVYLRLKNECIEEDFTEIYATDNNSASETGSQFSKEIANSEEAFKLSSSVLKEKSYRDILTVSKNIEKVNKSDVLHQTTNKKLSISALEQNAKNVDSSLRESVIEDSYKKASSSKNEEKEVFLNSNLNHKKTESRMSHYNEQDHNEIYPIADKSICEVNPTLDQITSKQTTLITHEEEIKEAHSSASTNIKPSEDKQGQVSSVNVSVEKTEYGTLIYAKPKSKTHSNDFKKLGPVLSKPSEKDVNQRGKDVIKTKSSPQCDKDEIEQEKLLNFKKVSESDLKRKNEKHTAQSISETNIIEKSLKKREQVSVNDPKQIEQIVSPNKSTSSFEFENSAASDNYQSPSVTENNLSETVERSKVFDKFLQEMQNFDSRRENYNPNIGFDYDNCYLLSETYSNSLDSMVSDCNENGKVINFAEFNKRKDATIENKTESNALFPNNVNVLFSDFKFILFEGIKNIPRKTSSKNKNKISYHTLRWP